MAAKKRSLGSTPLWMVGALGAAITALGFYIQTNANNTTSQMIAGTLGAVGGGVIGAAISIFFSTTEGRDTLAVIRKLLAETTSAGMRSDEKSLEWIRQQWHYYYLTRRDDQYLWRHIIYRFQDSTMPNSIEVLTQDEASGQLYVAHTEVALRDDRLIMVEVAKSGTEPPIVVVTPAFTEGYRGVRAGIVLLQTWDSTEMLSKCLWSTIPLVPLGDRDIPTTHAVKLDQIWKRNFAKTFDILPSVTDKPSA